MFAQRHAMRSMPRSVRHSVAKSRASTELFVPTSLVPRARSGANAVRSDAGEFIKVAFVTTARSAARGEIPKTVHPLQHCAFTVQQR